MKSQASNATTLPRYSALQISTTPRGRAIPIVYGTNKVTSDIVWAADFHNVAYQDNDGQSSGKGSGGGSGGKNGGQTEYYYFAALLGTMCEGPIYAFVAARNGSNWIYFNGNSPPFAWPITSKWPTASPGIIPYEGYPLLTYLGATTVPAQNMMPWEVATLQSGLYIQYEESGMTNDNKAVNPSSNTGFSQNGENWQNIGPNSWASQAFMLMPGYPSQPYPPYIGANYPSQIASYQNTAYWFCPAYQLGQSASPPTIDWFIVGLLPFDPFGAATGTPIVDAEPTAVITDLLTNVYHGANVSPLMLDPVTFANYRSYCISGGLFLSASIDSQIEVTQILNLITQQTVAVPFWSEGLLKIVPWYDQPISGYGSTYTPNLTPIYYLYDQHLIDQKNSGPIECQRTGIFDTYNQLNLNFNNRALNYSTDTITVDDQGSQEVWGVRPAPPAMAQYIADASVAAGSAQMQLQQLVYDRNTYTFSTPNLFCLLEPMDIVVINDAAMGIVNYPVRLQEISLNSNDEYQIVAQNLVDELYNVQARNQQVSLGTGLPGSVPPGNVYQPFIFTGPSAITGSNIEIWIAVTGLQQGWGGCNIWMSTDGTNYEKVAAQWAGARYGSLGIGTPTYMGSNPDDVDTFYVNVFGPNNQLSTVNTAQAAQGLTLALIQTGSNFELFSYQYVNLAGQSSGENFYALAGLYRGLMGTFGIAHNAGDQFARLDGNICKIPINAAMIGQTVYFKFPSFNTMGGMTQPLSQVTQYPFVIQGGTSSPEAVTNLVVGTDGKFTIITWTANGSAPFVVGYQIRYGVVGYNWQQAKPVINEISSTHTVSLIIPPGEWVFYVAAYDATGQFSAPASVTFTVPNMQVLFAETNFGVAVHALDSICVLEEDWGGSNATFTACSVHPTVYVLIPTDSSLASYVGPQGGWDWVDDFCITPPTTSAYLSPVINIGAGTTYVRASAQLYEYLWGVQLAPPNGLQTVGYLNPDWALPGVTLSGCFAHPTAWVIAPTDSLAASYSGADNGWEVFDYTVFSPPATSTITYVINAGGIFPTEALLSTSVTPAPNGSVPVFTGAINHSGDDVHWVGLATIDGAGQATGLAVDQYFQFVVTLNNSAGQQTNYPLVPDWNGVTLTNAIIHPTDWAIVPSDTALASYSGADHGWEVFDYYVISPHATSSVSFIANAGSVAAVEASLNSNIQAGPNQTLSGSGLYQGVIGYSNSPTGPFTTLSSGSATGIISGTITAQYFQYAVSLSNVQGNLVSIQAMTPSVNVLSPTSGGIGVLNSMMTEVIVGPTDYWTPVVPQIRTSPDGVTWGGWQVIPSTFTSQQFLQFTFAWPEPGAIWPYGIESVWLLTDGTPITQIGSLTTVGGTATVVFSTPFRQVPSIGGSSTASIVVAFTSVSATGFTVETFTSSTGATVNALVSWYATGI